MWARRAKLYKWGNDPFTVSGMSSSEGGKEDQVVNTIVRYTRLH